MAAAAIRAGRRFFQKGTDAAGDISGAAASPEAGPNSSASAGGSGMGKILPHWEQRAFFPGR